MEKDIRRHKRMYAFAQKVVTPIALRKYHYETDMVPETDYPCIIMSNHLTESDMLMVGRACRKFMYFVCGEHLLRSKHAKIIVRYFDPITKYKGATGMATVREILRRLKDGNNVMIFPEGSRSFNGETEPLATSIGKLVRTARCGLVTYRIQGGYFIAPRWAYHFRTGKARGKVMRVLSPDELRAMTPQQITDIINGDLYENAYETQRKEMNEYTGEGLAEGLENYLICCPNCKKYDTLVTEGDRFSCSCGCCGTYGTDGFLHGENLRFDSVYDWGKWTDEQFRSDMTGKDPSELLFDETDVKLYTVTPEHEQITLDTGSMQVYSDRMVFGEKTFRFEDITVMDMLYYGKTLLFTCDQGYFGITGEHFHARKCNLLYDMYMKGKQNA